MVKRPVVLEVPLVLDSFYLILFLQFLLPFSVSKANAPSKGDKLCDSIIELKDLCSIIYINTVWHQWKGTFLVAVSE